MSTTDQSWRLAWEPLTPRGVTAFAGASLGRLLLVQLIVASLAAASLLWFLEDSWFPIVRDAIRQLPSQGEISSAQLEWSGDSPTQLAANNFLGVAVDLFHSGHLGREAHLQVEFGRNDLRIYSLLGYQVIDYPPDRRFAFNRPELEPWWGAWSPAILVAVAFAVVSALMLTWTILATIYWLPVRLIAFLENRDLNWSQSWLLAGAALMPGSLFLTAGILAYSFNWMDLIKLGGMMGLHFVVGWIYLFISPLFCPRHSAAPTASNPFAAGKIETEPVAKKPDDKLN